MTALDGTCSWHLGRRLPLACRAALLWPGQSPADMVQFYWHALVMAQKLAYLYGWPDLLEKGEVDDQTEIYLTLLVGGNVGRCGG